MKNPQTWAGESLCKRPFANKLAAGSSKNQNFLGAYAEGVTSAFVPIGREATQNLFFSIRFV